MTDAGAHPGSDSQVDLAFPLVGTTLPADHGYLLYAALSRHLPVLHGDTSVGIHPVEGRLVGQRQLALTRQSCVTLRLARGRLSEAIGLAEKQLNVGASAIRLGFPTVRPLRPAAVLCSRLVTIRGFVEPEAFLDAVRRQMAALEVLGTPALLARRAAQSLEGQRREAGGPYIRRTLQISGKEVVGYAVGVEGLTAEESLRLQEAGIGGRRRFGCGVFVSWS